MAICSTQRTGPWEASLDLHRSLSERPDSGFCRRFPGFRCAAGALLEGASLVFLLTFSAPSPIHARPVVHVSPLVVGTRRDGAGWARAKDKVGQHHCMAQHGFTADLGLAKLQPQILLPRASVGGQVVGWVISCPLLVALKHTSFLHGPCIRFEDVMWMHL